MTSPNVGKNEKRPELPCVIGRSVKRSSHLGERSLTCPMIRTHPSDSTPVDFYPSVKKMPNDFLITALFIKAPRGKTTHCEILFSHKKQQTTRNDIISKTCWTQGALYKRPKYHMVSFLWSSRTGKTNLWWERITGASGVRAEGKAEGTLKVA